MENRGEGLPLRQRSSSRFARGSTVIPTLMSSTRAVASRIGTEISTRAAASDATGCNLVARIDVVKCSCVKTGRRFCLRVVRLATLNCARLRNCRESLESLSKTHQAQLRLDGALDLCALTASSAFNAAYGASLTGVVPNGSSGAD
jgi:hypothetical protein